MSSSESWHGTGGRAADIIDLDKFMRGGVRPSREAPSIQDLCDRLVVDNGGPSLKVNPTSSKESISVGRPTVLPLRRKNQKRYSHDSGLSDSSYTRRRHRPYRHTRGQEGLTQQRVARAQRSSGSLRAFRAVCERALIDQQKQIARVAQLCEKLTIQQTERGERGEAIRLASPDTSDLSSSSRSTRDLKRKDKRRTQECKTYKIIMNKLDELNRLFAAGGRSPLARPSPPVHPHRTPSSGSVTVSDKVVATEPEIKKARQVITSVKKRHVRDVQTPQLVEKAVGSSSGSPVGSQGPSTRVATLHAVTKAYAFDISPREAINEIQRRERPNIVTESIIKEEYSVDGSRSSKCDPRCGFDLNDPVHLYTQAKRLQALHASTRRRAHSADNRTFLSTYENEHERERTDRRTHEHSLCTLCRCYWRSLRHFITGQLFCCPHNYKYT